MTTERTTAWIEPVPAGKPSFLDALRGEALDQVAEQFAVLGIPHGVPYSLESATSPSSKAPASVRAASMILVPFLANYDFDARRPLFRDGMVDLVDCGDVTGDPGAIYDVSALTTGSVRKIVEKGAIPIVLGGDHSIPIPVLRAWEGKTNLTIVQIDAHIDWKNERHGVTEGLSSNMRRASEMGHVANIAHIGIRGIGSATEQDVRDATGWGAQIVSIDKIRAQGLDRVLADLPISDAFYITLDMDGIDPSIAPGVNSPSFGGLTFEETRDLLTGVASLGPVAGLDICEIAPGRDPHGMTSLLAAHLAVRLMASITAH